MKTSLTSRPLGLTAALGLAAALFGSAGNATAAIKTTTAQSIMVNLSAPINLAIVTTDTYEYNRTTAATYFLNEYDGNLPAVAISTSTTSSWSATTYGTAGTVDSGVPLVPDPDPLQLFHAQKVGNDDILNKNKCNFLDGATLVGKTYIQDTVQTVTVTTVTYPVLGTGQNRNINGYLTTVTTTTTTRTYTYVIAGNPAVCRDTNGDGVQEAPAPDFDNHIVAAWDFVGSDSQGGALVDVNAVIAGESVIKTSRYPSGKYSYSIDGRVVDLQVTLCDALGFPVGDPVPATSQVVKNTPGSVATPTTTAGEVIYGLDGALDFFYTENAGRNGVATSLLINGDARRILLGALYGGIGGDTFKGNNDGGADGSALALAVMDPLQLVVDVAGDFTLTLAGTVKGNAIGFIRQVCT